MREQLFMTRFRMISVAILTCHSPWSSADAFGTTFGATNNALTGTKRTPSLLALSPLDDDCLEVSRRSALSAAIATGIGLILLPETILAASDGIDDLYLAQPLGPPGGDGKLSSRPSAPMEYLLPAARVGVYIYQTLAIAEDLSKRQLEKSPDMTRLSDGIQKLDALLLSPPAFVKPSDPSVSRGDPYNSLPIIGEVGVAAQKRKERRDRSIDASPIAEFFEPGQLVGERRSWRALQRAEMKRESQSEVRRAFNIYTTNLNFNRNKYEWKGSREEKSQMIRADKLPTATDVIRSDLDARDLYRNEVQTALEDVKAEYLYQKKESGADAEKFDVTELLGLLKCAQLAADRWFSFIDDDDVKQALEAVEREQRA